MNPLTPDQYVTLLATYLQTWVTANFANQGVINTSGDPHELIEYLADGPMGFRVVVHWGGDKDQSGQEQAAIVTNTLEIYVVKKRGLKIDPGAYLLNMDAADPGFLVLLGKIREQIRQYLWPADVTYQYSLYKEGGWVDMGKDAETVVFRMTFELIATLPYIEYDVSDQQS